MIRLLEKIDNKNQPQYVPLAVEKYSKPDNCFFNVMEKVSKDNGEIIYGWKIHLSPILLVAERHAVWMSTKGELIDISPDPHNQQNIRFIQEDKGWIYDGEYTDNVRVNITENPIVDDLILMSEIITKLYQTGTRKSNAELLLLEPILQSIKSFENDNLLREQFIYKGSSIDSICYCGRAMMYKKCHGNNLKSVFPIILEQLIAFVETSSIKSDKK